MKHPVPQVKSILAFMTERGWTIADRNQATIFLNPPPYMVFKKPVRFEMPASENQEGYHRYIMFTVSSLAEMYDFKYQVLYDLLCYSYDDVQHLLEPKAEPAAAK